jgi:hypothetical protein
MGFGKWFWLALGTLGFFGVLSAFQNFHKPWREYPGTEYNSFPTPPDFQERTEFVFARLMYPDISFGGGGRRRRGGYGGWDWRYGGTAWTIDYPRCDRHFVVAMRRLSRIHTRSVESAINVEEGDHYDWPFLYAVEVGRWDLNEVQVKGLREYLLRGGFLMVDDFHGGYEWEVFVNSMKRVFPDRPIVDLDNGDQIFHAIYDLGDRIQVPGAYYSQAGITYERADGFPERWRGIYDDKGRLMVAICFNMDLGDAWEHADDPWYPQKFSAMAIRIGVNYVTYAMTH